MAHLKKKINLTDASVTHASYIYLIIKYHWANFLWCKWPKLNHLATLGWIYWKLCANFECQIKAILLAKPS